jgi:hypothetical protein
MSSTRRSGWRAASAVSAGGTSVIVAVWNAEMRTVPATDPLTAATSASASSTPVSRRSAWRARTTPASVRATRRPRRSSTAVPASRSSTRSCWETADGL